MTFQQTVLIIATIILLVVLAIVGVSLYKTTGSGDFPPVIGDCPDYWIDLEGDGSKCLNKKGLGTCNVPTDGEENTMNFNKAPFTGSDGDCAKYMWAQGCGVTWDGITSGVSNPCNNDDDS